MKARLASLKSHLQSATDLGPVLGEFLDLVESPGFFSAGRPKPAPRMQATLRALTGEKVGPVMVLRHDDEGFTHGSFNVGPRIGIIFSFDEIGKGLVALSGGASGQMDLFRFSATVAAGGTPPT